MSDDLLRRLVDNTHWANRFRDGDNATRIALIEGEVIGLIHDGLTDDGLLRAEVSAQAWDALEWEARGLDPRKGYLGVTFIVRYFPPTGGPRQKLAVPIAYDLDTVAGAHGAAGLAAYAITGIRRALGELGA